MLDLQRHCNGRLGLGCRAGAVATVVEGYPNVILLFVCNYRNTALRRWQFLLQLWSDLFR